MTAVLDKKRIEWVDVLRGIAIIFVLLAHYDGSVLGATYAFAHKFCVALFFFISGMMTSYSADTDFAQYAKKQALRLLVPYTFFALTNTAFYFLFNRHIGIGGMADMLVTYIIGKRNTLATAPMWFLPCLFVVCLLYRVISNILKEHRFIVPVCFIVSAVAKLFFEEPIMLWSINHGFKYLIYYAIGAAAFPQLKNISFSTFKSLPPYKKIILTAAAAIDIWYVYMLYTKGSFIPTYSLASACAMVFVNAMAIICFMTLTAVCISWFKPLGAIGRETLGFCCSESISRALLNTAMAVTGIGFATDSPFKIIAYNFIAMAISYVVIITPLNLLCPVLLGKKAKHKKEKQKV